jgi:cytochrome c biogenesis protein CcmG, thiol:disulfide interchange protein DsbE
MTTKNLLNRRFRIFTLLWLALTSLAPQADAQSSQFNIADYKGKVVYLDFWASWCGPCKQSFTYMAGLKQQYGAKGLAVVTVNMDKSPAQAAAFMKKVGVTLPVTYDSNGTVAKRYGVKTMPTSFVIDRTGKMRFTHQGFYPAKTSEYSTQVAQIVNEH